MKVTWTTEGIRGRGVPHRARSGGEPGPVPEPISSQTLKGEGLSKVSAKVWLDEMSKLTHHC